MSAVVSDRLLNLYALDLLEPHDAADVAARLAAAGRSAPVAVAPRGDGAEVWVMPPPGLGRLASVGELQVAATAAHVVGETLRLAVDCPEDPDAFEVIVLRREADGWTVWIPEEEAGRVPLSALEDLGDGRRALDLVTPGPVGRQWWGVVLAPRGGRVDWGAPSGQRWAALRAAVGRGELAVDTVSVEVRSPARR
jgi:hypothetical protein